jgi:outer membrane protein
MRLNAHQRAVGDAFPDVERDPLARAKQQVAYDVTQAFLQTVLDKQLVGIAEQTLKLSTTREDQLTELVKVGRRAPPDLYRQQAQTAADRVNVVDAQNRLRADEILLLRRLRLRPDSGYTFIEPPADTTHFGNADAGLATLIEQARSQRADLQAASAQATAATLDVQRARGGYLPKVDVGLAYFGDARVFDKQILRSGAGFTQSPAPARSDRG